MLASIEPAHESAVGCGDYQSQCINRSEPNRKKASISLDFNESDMFRAHQRYWMRRLGSLYIYFPRHPCRLWTHTFISASRYTHGDHDLMRVLEVTYWSIHPLKRQKHLRHNQRWSHLFYPPGPVWLRDWIVLMCRPSFYTQHTVQEDIQDFFSNEPLWSFLNFKPCLLWKYIFCRNDLSEWDAIKKNPWRGSQ